MLTYKQSGVDIDKGNDLVKRLQALCPDIGGFGGLYPLGDSYLVASTDGVGTKLKIAFGMQRHDTVGIDLVAMCVNDIITTGAKPLFFLDYFATSKLDVDKAENVLKGILEGCRQADCVLLGGETAEMPGFYDSGEYDIAGFAVGIVPKKALIDGSRIQKGDLLVGIPSSGLHSNGYSLARKIEGLDPETLLVPTKIYVKQIMRLQERFQIKGIAHITGGGITENVPRMFPEGLGAVIHLKSWEIPSIFKDIQIKGRIDSNEMYRTFNMGVGMVLALSPECAKELCKQEPECFEIGFVKEGKGALLT